MDINYELYKVFYSVAKNLSFTASASEMFLSQSAVSQSIKQLEQKLGCTLFNRSTKSVRLTADGEMLFEYVEKAVTLLKAGEQMLIGKQQLSPGEIRIASTDTICKYFLLPQIKSFQPQYPNIKFKLVNKTSLDCLDLLKDGEVDLAVTHLPTKLPKNVFKIEKYINVKDSFIYSEEYWKGKKLPVSVSDLADVTLIVLDKNTVTRRSFDMLLSGKNISAAPEIELTSVDLLIEMTKAGLGMGFVPTYCLRGTEGLAALQLKENLPSRKLGVLTNPRFPRTELISRFIQTLELV